MPSSLPSGVPSRSDAAARYLQAATEANTRVATARAAWVAGATDLTRVRAGLLAVADAKERLDATVAAIRPPPGAVADVATLLTADRALEAALRAAANSTTAADLTALEPHMLDVGRAALDAANAVRRDLGLPPAP